VRIDGEWCPVQSFHYLKRGNAPDWAASHVCVLKYKNPLSTSTCDRFALLSTQARDLKAPPLPPDAIVRRQAFHSGPECGTFSCRETPTDHAQPCSRLLQSSG